MGREEKKIVYQAQPRKPGEKATSEMTDKEIADKLERNPDLQKTTKATGGHSRVDIDQKDTYTEAQKDKYKSTPNYNSSIANVKTKGRSDVTILSKKKNEGKRSQDTNAK